MHTHTCTQNHSNIALESSNAFFQLVILKFCYGQKDNKFIDNLVQIHYNLLLVLFKWKLHIRNKKSLSKIKKGIDNAYKLLY